MIQATSSSFRSSTADESNNAHQSDATPVVATNVLGGAVGESDYVLDELSETKGNSLTEVSPSRRTIHLPALFQVRNGFNTAARSRDRVSRPPSVTDLAYLALTASGYPLQDVRCQLIGQKLILSGVVMRYYYLQMALETVRRVTKGYRIETQIEVRSAPNHHDSSTEPASLDH